ncbi:MAG TPA: hypothetical protein VD886_20565 [Herpetosiphonaceae bacterium]|nr:hypothetical protein [Herpetosiphonaceae bacterium]
MRCPNCYHETWPAAFCARCGAALPAGPAIPGAAGPVPLSPGQRAWLLLQCLPFAAWVGLLALALIFVEPIYGRPMPAPLLLLMGLVILVTGYRAVQCCRDLAAGRALVAEDVMERSWRSGQGKAMYFGSFERLGKLRLRGRDHVQSSNGWPYRVTYSPVSKTVWKLERLQPARGR